MDRLVIRDGELRGAIAAVHSSRTEFAQAVSRTDTLQEAVGHRRLSEALHGFESRWSVRREKLVATLETIEKQLQGVLDQFGEWDRASAAAAQPTVEGTPPAPPAQSVAPQAPASPGLGPAPVAPGSPDATLPTAPSYDAPPAADSPSTATEPAPEPVPDPSTGEPPLDSTDPDEQAPTDLPGSPDAINALLDRLEGLPDSPAGLAALAGSVGALTVLLALFAPGSSTAPGMTGVDPTRVQALLDRLAPTTDDRFAELFDNPATATPPAEPELGELPAEPDAEPGVLTEVEAGGESDVDPQAATESAEGHEVEPSVAEAPPGGAPAGGAPGASTGPAMPSPTDLPPPPEPIADGTGDSAPTTSPAFDERFPARDDVALTALDAPVARLDVDAELDALASANGEEERSGAGMAPRMTGMGAMPAAGMGAMAAASGTPAASAHTKGVDARDERLEAVRRELDELRGTTTQKEERA